MSDLTWYSPSLGKQITYTGNGYGQGFSTATTNDTGNLYAPNSPEATNFLMEYLAGQQSQQQQAQQAQSQQQSAPPAAGSTGIGGSLPGGTSAGDFASSTASGLSPLFSSDNPNIQAAANLYQTPASMKSSGIAQLASSPQKALAAAGLDGDHMADGGTPSLAPDAISMPHPAGLFNGATGGRSDVLPRNVPVDSHVIPADVVSGLGEGNTASGSAVLDKMFNTGPFGMKLTPHGFGRHIKRHHMANGGKSHTNIVAAAGEYLVPPEVVAKIGGGDIKHGHDILDHFILHTRKATSDKLRKLPPPKK